jgi:hypothetical protein
MAALWVREVLGVGMLGASFILAFSVLAGCGKTPLTLSLSKGPAWFDKLTTNGATPFSAAC